MSCLSTWTMTARMHGLLAALDELKDVAPTSLFVEAVEPLLDAKPGFDAIVARGVRILGVQFPLEAPPTKDAKLPTLDTPDDAAWEQTLRLVEQWLPRLAAGSVTHCVLEVGNGGLAPASSDAAKSESPGRKGREAVIDRCCRRLFDLSRREPVISWLLRIPAVADSVFDVEAGEWIFEALKAHRVGVALDLGRLHLRATRGQERVVDAVNRLAKFAGLVLLTDGDGTRRTRLFPGMGTLDWPSLRQLLPKRVPWVVVPDPVLPLGLLASAIEVVRDQVGWTEIS